MVLRLTAAATHGFTMVLFTEAVSRRNTYVGGTCTPPSAILFCKSNDVDTRQSVSLNDWRLLTVTV